MIIARKIKERREAKSAAATLELPPLPPPPSKGRVTLRDRWRTRRESRRKKKAKAKPIELSETGRVLLNDAFGIELVVFEEHLINEEDPEMKAYNILSIPKDAIINLVEGDIERGLPEPLEEYVKVEFNGKVGLISKFVVEERDEFEM